MKFGPGLCCLALCSLLSLPMPTLAQGEPDLSALISILESMDEGDWAKVNLNRFDEVYTPAELRELFRSGNPEPYKIITAWSSFAWDPNRGDLIIFGGGHANYSNNDVYRWRGTTRRWERAALPSALARDCVGNWQAVDGVDAAPVSSHTYDNNIFLPIVDRFVTFGGAAHDHGSAFMRDLNCSGERATGPYFFDPSRADGNKVGGSTGSHVQREGSFDWVVGGNMWENRDVPGTVPGNPSFPRRFVDGATGYAEENGKDVVYAVGFSGGTSSALYKYTVNNINDPTQDTWEHVGRYWNGLSGEGSGAFSPTMNAFVRIAGSRIGYWDLDTAGPDNRDVIISLNDPSGSYQLSSHDGLEYDPTRDQFMIWGGQSEVWALQQPTELGPSGWTIVPQPTPSGAAPSGSDGTGVLGKWNYIPNLDAFLGMQAVNAQEGAVWLYKPVGWTNPVAPDADADGIPDGVEMAYGLNPNDPGDAAGDLDNDGLTNLEEYQGGTDLASADAIPPTIDPAGGSFSAPVLITLDTATAGATIYYTLDGSTPTDSALLYENPFQLGQSATIRAIALRNGYTPSSISSAIFEIDGASNQPPQVALTAPASDMSVEVDTPLLISATASDPEGALDRVEFYLDETLIGTDTTAPFELQWNANPTGIYQLSAVAHDDFGGSASSASITLTILPAPGDRVSDGLLVYYPFSQGSGDTVFDLSGNPSPLNLQIQDPDNTRWLSGGGLAVDSATRLLPLGDDAPLYNAITATGQLTVEAWVRPANLSQGGPARIVTFSGGSSVRNFTLGQGADEYRARLRTTDSDTNGLPEARAGGAATTLQQVVMSFDASTLRLYVDGALVDSVSRSGDFSNWDSTHGFALANELGTSRPWLGDYHLVALYDRALSEAEILQNYVAGGGNGGGGDPDTPPQITSTAPTSATTGASYSYQVLASGNPAPSFAVSGAPSGMSMDNDTGLLSWPNPVVGSYNLSVSASNSVGSDQQSYVLTVSEATPPPDIEGLIIDDGDPGTSYLGNWQPSSGANPYDGDSLYSNQSNDEYRYESYLSGMLRLYLWWTEFSNRSDAVTVEIWDGNQRLDQVVVNQQTNGGTWNLLSGPAGPDYTFVDQVRVVIIASGGATTSADALRLVPMEPAAPNIGSSPVTVAILGQPYSYPVSASGEAPLSYSLDAAPAGMSIDPATGEISWTPGATGNFQVTVRVSNSLGEDTQSYSLRVDDPVQAVVLDNGDPGTTALGNWRVSGADGAYGNNSVYSKSLGDSYVFEKSLNGPYEVWVWWTEYSNRADQVPIEIHHAGGAVTTVFVDQRSQGGQWNLLGDGAFDFDGSARVEIQVPAGGQSTSADAVKFQQVAAP